MEKYTVKQLKNLVNSGVAKDVTLAKSMDEITEPYTQIGYAEGVYGCTGMLLKGVYTNNLYAVVGRTTAIYLF